MPKCLACDKKGIFLKLTNGLCPQCSRTAQQSSVATRTPALCTPATLSREESALLSKISKINACGGELTNELYQQLREFEVNWLERNYDFNSIEGVQSIPVSKNIPGAPSPKGPMKGHTGEVYYYLRRKGYEHEDAGNIELALECLRKSNALLKCRGFHDPEDCYPLVKMLARAGYVEEAYKEKADIEKRCINVHDLAQKRISADLNWQPNGDLVIMDAHGATCSECAKYQGRVYSLSGKSKLFPKAPGFILQGRCLHDGCSHSFWPYEHGISNDDLAYTLSVHPLQNKKYGENIVVFSNRPFVDDRTEECKKSAEAYLNERKKEQEQKQRYLDTMVETEAKRGQEIRDFKWIQEHITDKCPKNITGYRRMKTQNTKNYQALKQAAAKLGYTLS